MRPLSLDDVKELLRKLTPLSDRIVLVGGQAVNFWGERYMANVPALQSSAPFTSKDIDFSGGEAEVTELAQRLGGEAKFASPDDHVSAQIGIVSFLDPEGQKRVVDVIRLLHGLQLTEVVEMSLPFEVAIGNDQLASFRVMHPVHCLESRAFNTSDLPGYQTEHAVRQLRASVVCAREFLREILDAGGAPRDVLRLNERVFKFRRDKPAAAKVLCEHGVDVFDAVLTDERLPEKFLTIRYPQMRKILRLS